MTHLKRLESTIKQLYLQEIYALHIDLILLSLISVICYTCSLFRLITTSDSRMITLFTALESDEDYIFK